MPRWRAWFSLVIFAVGALGSAGAPAAHEDPGAGATSVPARRPAGRARPVDDILAAVRAATARYLDLARAREDGFIQASGMEPRHGYHFINPAASVVAAAAGLSENELDLSRPPMLIYVERDGVWQLAGVEYALPRRPSRNPFPGADWHEHEASCHYRDFREVAAARASDCPARHPESGAEYVLWHPVLAVAHVWAWYPNPDGPFAAENRYLAPYGEGTPAMAGHRHPRHPAELAYSQFTHRFAGAVLLVLAVVIVWESRRSRPFPWNAGSAALWIVFGVYLFFSSDPESWPWGPRPFRDIFDDALVLQHKVLALIPIAIGGVDGLRAGGILTRGRWLYLVPALAVFGGLSLFLHFHEGRFHIDEIYLQHAAMGLTALALGVTLVVGRRSRRAQALLAWAWPGFLALMALVLLLYTEA